jgi:hypothetical protein
VPVDREVRDPGGQTTEKIEKEITEVPAPVLHVVPEDEQGPHVAQEVNETAVKEHEREKREDLLAQREIV